MQKVGVEDTMLGNIEFWKFGVPPTVDFTVNFPSTSVVIPATIALIPLFPYITGKLVEEKECSMKQLLVVMGMRMHTFFLSWFLLFAPLLMLISGILTLIFYIGQMLVNSGPIFFAVTSVYALCIFAQSFFFSTLFTSSRKANVYSTFVSVLSSVLYVIVPLTKLNGFPFVFGLPRIVVYFFMIFPPFTYAIAIDQVNQRKIPQNLNSLLFQL